MTAAPTLRVTNQQLRLRHAGGGYSWIEEWRGDDLLSLCFAEDLHPERFAPSGEQFAQAVNEMSLF